MFYIWSSAAKQMTSISIPLDRGKSNLNCELQPFNFRFIYLSRYDNRYVVKTTIFSNVLKIVNTPSMFQRRLQGQLIYALKKKMISFFHKIKTLYENTEALQTNIALGVNSFSIRSKNVLLLRQGRTSIDLEADQLFK